MTRRPAPLAVLLALGVVAGLALRPLAAEDPTATRVAASVDRVLAALAAGDEPVLARLAAQDDPDPWLVADALFAYGRLDAAQAFARAAPRPDVNLLPAYLDTLEDTTDDAEVRARLLRANEALVAMRQEDALAATEPVPSPPLERLVTVRLTGARGFAPSNLGRPLEAGAALLAAAQAAERLGWLARAATSYSAAAEPAGETGGVGATRDALALALAASERRGQVAAH